MSEEQNVDRQKRLEHIENELTSIRETVDRIDKELSQYRGMVGGVLLVLTALGAAVKLAWGWLAEHFVANPK